MNRILLTLATAGGLAVAAQAQIVTTLVDETFAAGERTNLNLPNGAQWFSSAGNTTVTYTAGSSIALATGINGRHLLAYFTADGSPAALTNTGDSLTVTFAFSLNGVPGAMASATTGMRVGLFDSTAGSRISADSSNVATNFDNYTGYTATFAPGATVANGLSLRERTLITNEPLISSNAAYTPFSGNASSQALTYGSTYTGVFTMLKTDSGLDLSISITGPGVSNYSLTKSDSTPSTAFDTFAILNGSNVSDGITISDFVVTQSLVTPIPEPSAVAALAGAAVLGLAASRRRRR